MKKEKVSFYFVVKVTPELHRDAKIAAAKSYRSLASYVRQAVDDAVKKDNKD